jgi:hypothetical protein
LHFGASDAAIQQARIDLPIMLIEQREQQMFRAHIIMVEIAAFLFGRTQYAF